MTLGVWVLIKLNMAEKEKRDVGMHREKKRWGVEKKDNKFWLAVQKYNI